MIVTGFDYTRRRILVIERGASTRAEVLEQFEMLFANADFHSGFDLLWDRSLAEADQAWTSEDIRRLAEQYGRLKPASSRAPAREAVVVARNDTLTFGLTRMFQMQTDDARRDGEMRIFETRADAEAWLDAASPSGP